MPLESVYLNGGFIGVTKSYVTRELPTVVGTATRIISTGSSSHPVNLPSGDVDDLLIIFLVTDSTSTFTNPTGWNQLLNTQKSSTRPSALISYRWATGSEGSTVNVAAGGSGGSPGGVNASMRIRGGNVGSVPKIASVDSSSTASPNPPSLTPNVGISELLWVAAGLWSGSTGTISSYPTNYTLGQAYVKNTQNSSTAWGSLGISARQLDTLTEDPGAYTISAASIASAATIAVEGKATSTGIWNLQAVLESLYQPNITTTATFISSVEDLTNTTTPTFSNYDTSSFLTTDRMVIVVAGDLTGAQVTGVTVGGQPCDQDLSPTATGSGFAGIYSKSNVSGSTNNIIVTVSGTVNRAAIGVFKLRNSDGSVPTLKFSDFSLLAATSGTGGTDTLNMPSGSVGILVASYGDAGFRVTWNGITTEHVDKDFTTEGSAGYSIASIDAELSDRPAQSITTSHSSTSTGYTVVGCSYG